MLEECGFQVDSNNVRILRIDGPADEVHLHPRLSVTEVPLPILFGEIDNICAHVLAGGPNQIRSGLVEHQGMLLELPLAETSQRERAGRITDLEPEKWSGSATSERVSAAFCTAYKPLSVAEPELVVDTVRDAIASSKAEFGCTVPFGLDLSQTIFHNDDLPLLVSELAHAAHEMQLIINATQSELLLEITNLPDMLAGSDQFSPKIVE